MITNEQIKKLIAPKIADVMAKGYTVTYKGYARVTAASEEDGIKVSAWTDLDGQYEFLVDSDHLYIWGARSEKENLDDLLSQFTVTLTIKELYVNLINGTKQANNLSKP